MVNVLSLESTSLSIVWLFQFISFSVIVILLLSKFKLPALFSRETVMDSLYDNLLGVSSC